MCCPLRDVVQNMPAANVVRLKVARVVAGEERSSIGRALFVHSQDSIRESGASIVAATQEGKPLILDRWVLTTFIESGNNP